MKTIAYVFLLGMLFFSNLNAQGTSKYWIESSDLDSLVLINNGKYQTIKGFKDNTNFNIERTNNQPLYLKPYCAKPGCRDSISIKLWGEKEDAYTRWIYLQPEDSISIDVCFSQYPEASFLSQTFQGITEAIVAAFWKSVSGGGRVISGQRSVLKGGDPPKPDESKLSFAESDYFRYRKLKDFQLSFEVGKEYPVKSVYIISHEGDLLFCGGDPSLVMEVFPAFKKEQAPKLSAFLSSQASTDTAFKKYELNMEKMKPDLLAEMKPGAWYQLGIELEKDQTDFNPYLFNFQFFTAEDLKRMEDFIK